MALGSAALAAPPGSPPTAGMAANGVSPAGFSADVLFNRAVRPQGPPGRSQSSFFTHAQVLHAKFT